MAMAGKRRAQTQANAFVAALDRKIEAKFGAGAKSGMDEAVFDQGVEDAGRQTRTR